MKTHSVRVQKPRKKIGKKQIDQMFREKQDLVLRAEQKNIELGKLLVNNYGP